MSIANEHPAYVEESSRFQETLAAMGETVRVLEGKQGEIDGSWNDRAVARQLAEMDSAMVKNLRLSLKQPYFARVDVRESQTGQELRLYIGKTGYGHDRPAVQVIDWRAPIADLYYSSSGGMSSYAAPGGSRKAEVLLKRKFDVQEGRLLAIFDEQLLDRIQKAAGRKKTAAPSRQKTAVTDEFLNYRLQGRVDNRLKEIVATIQKEQNKIIRAGKDHVLVVQGAAGSGKSTIALHRLSYLIYHNQGSFTADRLLIIAPNRLFLDYISDVLPELGVESVAQETVESLAFRLLGAWYRINDPEKMELLHSQAQDEAGEEERRRVLTVSRFKSSLDFMETIDRCLDHWRQEFAGQLQDIVLPGAEFSLPAAALRDKLVNMDQPLANQVQKLKSFILENLRRHLYGDGGFRQGRYAQVRESCRVKLDELRLTNMPAEEISRLSQALQAERDSLIRRIEQEEKSFPDQFFVSWPEWQPPDAYRQLLASPRLLKKLARKKFDFQALADHSARVFASHQLEREDLAPLVYLKYRLQGLPEAGRYLHMVVDEAQDISPFEYQILGLLSANRSMTIVGDMAQGIHDFRGIDSWQSLLDQLAPKKNQLFAQLDLSYRSTMEIIRFANGILQAAPKNTPLAQPVIRSGSLPEVVEAPDLTGMMDLAADKVSWYLERGYKSVAVLARSAVLCQQFHHSLAGRTFRIEVNLITRDQTSYRRGITIAPIYLAKGLEFDAVILLDGSAPVFGTGLRDLRLLYVAVTRALHCLTVYFRDQAAPLIAATSPELRSWQGLILADGLTEAEDLANLEGDAAGQ